MNSAWRPLDDGADAPRVHPVVRFTWLLFVASIPFELPTVDLPAEVPTLTGALFLATTVLHPSACYRRAPWALIGFAAYLWVLGLSAVVNGLVQHVLALQHVVWLVQLFLLFWVGVALLRHEPVYRATVMVLVITCAVRAAIQVSGLAAEIHPLWGGGQRVTAFGQNANLSAMILAAGLVVTLGARDATGRAALRPWLAWPLAGLMGVAVIDSGSRGGLACAAAGLLALLAAGRTHRLRHLLVGGLAAAVLGFGVARSETMRYRIGDAEAGHLAGRERLYPAALAMVRERPVLGWGPVDNQFELARRVAERMRPRRDMHNLALELLTTAGVLGAAPFLVGFALCARGAWRARHGPRGVVPFALLVAMLPGLISGTWIAAKILWLALTVAAASEPGGSRRAWLVPGGERQCAA